MKTETLEKKIKELGSRHGVKFIVAIGLETIWVSIISDDFQNIVSRIGLKDKYDFFISNLDLCNISEDLAYEFFKLVFEYSKTDISDREHKRYIIPLPGLVTTDGKQQYLTHKEGRFFASRRKKKLRQTWKEKDLINVPEVYRKYAVEVEDEI